MNRNFYTSKYATAKFAVGIAIVFGVIAALSPVLTVYWLTIPREYIVQNAQGNYYIARGVQLPDAQEILTNCISTAALALLNRTSDGVLDPVALQQSFLPQCGETIKEMLKNTEQEFATKHIRQLAEIEKVRAVNTEGSRYRAVVVGRLTRACHYMGESFVERLKFRASFLCAENPDMRRSGMFPLVVYHIEKMDITPQEEQAEKAAAK